MYKENKNSTTPINGGFNTGLENLIKKDYPTAKRELLVLFPNLMTFHNKRYGKTPITPSEIIAIQTVFDKYGIDAFTGEPINN